MLVILILVNSVMGMGLFLILAENMPAIHTFDWDQPNADI